MYIQKMHYYQKVSSVKTFKRSFFYFLCCDFYCSLRLDGSARVSGIKWWMLRIISLWIERAIASYIFKNIDFWSMRKRGFLIFISKTICRITKFQMRKRCTSTRRAITHFLFRIFMHFDFLLIIGIASFEQKMDTLKFTDIFLRTLKNVCDFFSDFLMLQNNVYKQIFINEDL